MLCQQCQQREAKVHLVKNINGEKQEMYLCEQCASKAQEFNLFIHPGVVVPDFLQALFGVKPQQFSPEQSQEESCPNCGMTFSQITRASKLGCSVCYEKFESQLQPLLRKIHGGGQHVGKVPLRRGAVLREKLELNKLKEKLKVLVQEEKFEEAVLIRDEIRRLEQNMGG